jgi:hypothetical protein
MCSIEELQGKGGANYPIDIVFCIDVTGSMRDCIENVKKMAVNFKDEFLKTMEELGKQCSGGIRTKVIAFRDEKNGEEKEVSPFYTMPDQEDEFKAFVSGLKHQGGGDEPESAYEALIEAFKSEWVDKGAKRRWVTVMFTDASAHPEKFAELVDAWNALDFNFKRLVIFAPDHATWSDFAGQAQNTLYYQSEAGKGLEEHDKDAILKALAASI